MASLELPPHVLEAVNPDCPGCCALLTYFGTAITEAIIELRTRVEQLEARTNQNSSNSSRPPSADPPSAPKRTAKTTPSGRKPGGQPGHSGVTRELKPTAAVDEVVPLVPPLCRHCHEKLPQDAGSGDPAPSRHQVVELPVVLVRTTEYQLHARTCPRCGERTWASLPEGVPAGVAGPRLQAACSLLTGCYRLSRRCALELVRDLFGEELSLGTLMAMEQATAAALERPYQEAAEAVAQSSQANVDETRWRQGKLLAWLWTAATARIALFRIDPSRSRAAFEALLPPTKPGQHRTVTSDRYSAYTHQVGDEWQICWSHLDRDFQGWVDARGAAAPFGIRALQVSHQLFHRWHQFRDGSMDRPALCRQLAPLQAELRQVLEEARESDHWKVAGPAGNLLKHWDSLWTFTRREGVEPTNNHAERALRRGVLWRKGSFGNQSEGGRAFVERMLTTVASLRLQGRSVLDYLEEACGAARSGVQPPSLLSADSR